MKSETPPINLHAQVMQYLAEQKAAGRDIGYGEAFREYAEAHGILVRLSVEQARQKLEQWSRQP